jgi:hypothetical protein
MLMNATIPDVPDTVSANAQTVLSVLLILAVCLLADGVIGIRGIDVGTDTHVYAGLFHAMRHGFVATRLEPGFVMLTRLLSATGMSVVLYQAILFGVSLVAAAIAARRYSLHLGAQWGYLTFLTAVLMFLFLSPMFVNASVNAVRQGMASLLVFTAMLSVQERRWRNAVLFGVVAASLHYSSLLYLAFAPFLLLSTRLQRIVAVVAFLAYCSGLSMVLTRMLVPSVYTDVMAYQVDAVYRSGVRIDFAVFSMAWYLIPFVASRLVCKPFNERIKQSASVYMAMLLPFFAIGWGNYSNRLLLAPWVAASLMMAAIFCFARTPLMRNPLLLRGGMVAAVGVFIFYVTHQVMI